MTNNLTTKTDLTTHALCVAKIAAKTARGYFRGKLGVEFKADESPVTQADKAVEADVRAYLRTHFPDHGIFGEEQGVEGADCAEQWIVDPIDGTRSFLSGHPLFGFLLAHMRQGKVNLGVIGMPALDEVFVGTAWGGATLNGAPIRVSGTTRLRDAVLYVNEGDKIHDRHSALFARLMQQGQTRRFAYDCYPHALLAAGHVDAVVDYDLQPYDFLPVQAVVEAAGGVITDWAGQLLTLQSDGSVIAAATRALHAELLEIVRAG